VELDRPVVRGAVSIALPKGWVVRRSEGAGGGRTLLIAQAPMGEAAGADTTGQYQATLSITVDPASDNIDGARAQESAARVGTGYQAVEKPVEVTQGNLKGVTFGGTFGNGRLKLRSRQYLFNVDGKLYGITFTCLASSWGVYAPMLEASVGTFAVK
jgi:hypothetical protein